MKLLSLPRRWSAVLLLGLVLSVGLTSCGTPIAGESWPGITVDSSAKYLYVAYKEQIFRITVTPPAGTQPLVRHMDWRTVLPNNAHTYAPPALSPDGKILYAGAYDHNLYALDADTGAMLATWQPPTTDDKLIGGPLATNDLVYIGMGDKGVKAFDAHTGALKASFDGTAFGVWSHPVIDEKGETLFVGSLDHNVYALDAKTLQLKWKVDVNGSVAGTPLYSNGLLYVGTFGNELLQISTDEHKIVNRFATKGWVWGTPVIVKGDNDQQTLLFTDLAGYIYALDITDGKWAKKWETTDLDHPGAIRGSVGVYKNEVVVGSESHYLHYYNLDNGSVINPSADMITAKEIYGDMHVIGNQVIFSTMSEDEIVRAFSTDSGTGQWAVKLSDEVNYLATQTLLPPTIAPTSPPAVISPATLAPTSGS